MYWQCTHIQNSFVKTFYAHKCHAHGRQPADRIAVRTRACMRPRVICTANPTKQCFVGLAVKITRGRGSERVISHRFVVPRYLCFTSNQSQPKSAFSRPAHLESPRKWDGAICGLPGEGLVHVNVLALDLDAHLVLRAVEAKRAWSKSISIIAKVFW